jgi:hypothetical protein
VCVAVVAVVDVVDPPVTVPVVLVPLPAAFPVALVSLTTGVPPPVSVAVVPVVEVAVLWIVSVEPAVDSAGCRLHAAKIRSNPIPKIFRMSWWSAM